MLHAIARALHIPIQLQALVASETPLVVRILLVTFTECPSKDFVLLSVIIELISTYKSDAPRKISA